MNSDAWKSPHPVGTVRAGVLRLPYFSFSEVMARALSQDSI